MAFHAFKVGRFKCVVLSEAQSTFSYEEGLSRLVVNATWDEIKPVLDAIGEGAEGIHAMNPLLIDDGGRVVLVDTGIGVPERSGLLPALSEAGYSPADVNIVYITHFHGDHYNGVSDAEGKPTFPNARYITTQIEWDFWMNHADSERVAGIKAKLLPLKDEFSLVNPGDEILPGVSVLAIPGHTPGQSGLVLESEGDKLVFLVDVLHRIPQFARTDWQIAFDSDKDQAVATRQSMLEQQSSEGSLTMFYHLAFPGLGHVVTAGDGFAWQPLD